MRIGRQYVLVTERGDAGHASESGNEGRRGIMIVVLVLVLFCAAVFAGRLWWTHPLKRSVSLPPGIEQGETLFMGGTLPAPRTRDGGMFSAEDLRSVNHEWVITAIWYPRGGPEETADLRLGESAHFDGLGTVTWLEADPPPIVSISFTEPVWLELNKMAFWGGCCGIPGWCLRSTSYRIVACGST